MKNNGTALSLADLAIEPEQLSSRLEKFICQMIDEFKRDGAIIGLSGGLVSSSNMEMEQPILCPFCLYIRPR